MNVKKCIQLRWSPPKNGGQWLAQMKINCRLNIIQKCLKSSFKLFTQPICPHFCEYKKTYNPAHLKFMKKNGKVGTKFAWPFAKWAGMVYGCMVSGVWCTTSVVSDTHTWGHGSIHFIWEMRQKF